MSLQQAFDQASALLRQGQFAQVRHLCQQILAIQPSFEVYYMLGIAGLNEGKFAEALESFDRALALKPGNAEIWNNRGGILQQLGRDGEALTSYEKALAIRPAYAVALNNRAIILHRSGRSGEAAAEFQKAVSAAPDYAQAWNNRGNLLQDTHNFDLALESFDRAVALDPTYAEAWNNRGNSLWDMRRFDEALASYDRALAIQPDYVKALYNRGNLQWAAHRRYQPAVQDLEKAAALDPQYEYLPGALLHLRMQAADWRDFDGQMARLETGIAVGKRIAESFVGMTVLDSPSLMQTCSTIYTRQHYPSAPLPLPAARAHGKLRVGYVSGEWREHATAYLMAGLFEAHDRSKFEITAFDTGRNDDSPMRRRLEAAFDKFTDLSSLADDAAAARIAADEIDILVNLNGYFGAHRMGIFARKPAPIQVNYLGFPATLGASFIDYIIADRFLIPPGEEVCYTENVVWMPDSYQVNDSRRAVAQAGQRRADHGLAETGFVFCSFNQSYKLAPPMFALWLRLLDQVEGSQLWLLENNPDYVRNLRAEASRHGVASERLVFAPHVPREQHLARLALADLFLDTVPCNAHTMASDALWAGLPLLTCCGGSFAGRVAGSLLNAVGLPELVAGNLAAYEALALQLARAPERLRPLRDRLIQNRGTSALFDTARFCRHLETGYARMWEKLRAGEAPRSFAVDPEG